MSLRLFVWCVNAVTIPILGSDWNCDPRGAPVLLCGPRWCETQTEQLFLFVQKDAHTLYLEQELESLRAVLEIKTNQIHQQDKKLMQMDKLVRYTYIINWYTVTLGIMTWCIYLLIWNCVCQQIDGNLKLEECLKKVQQENEDYKARMDKHAALSK